MKQLSLPNGDSIYYIDKVTALYIYNEIYGDEVYLYGGMEIKEGDTILDIGANIGLFSRYISSQAKNLRIFTFEPVPPIFEVLVKNVENIPASVTNFNFGLGEKKEKIEFNYYPRVSGDSAAVAPDWESKIDLMVEHYDETVAQDMPIAKLVPKFLRKRVVRAGIKRMYKPQKVVCKIRPLSEIIEENQIDHIEFMKVDAENYEWQVLRGITDADWNKIDQIALEVHSHIKGGDTLLQDITTLLKEKGFKTYLGEESRETMLNVYMLYGKKE